METPPAAARRGSWMGLGVMAASLLLVELATHGPFATPPLLRITLLIGLLAAVAFAAFVGGVNTGVGGAVLVALLAIHALGPHGAFPPSASALQSGGVLFLLALAIALVVGLLQRRADRLAHAALDAERRHAAELAGANEGLRRANEALEAFAYLVSHDLKEPVRTADMLLGFLEDDHSGAMSEDARDLLRRARGANERLSRLLASLLDLSRASRLDRAEAVALDVGDVVRSEACAVRYQDVLRERGGALEIRVEPDARALATPAAVAQIFGNLVANALHHNPAPAPRVVVRSVSGGDGFVAFLVEDNGKGFPPGLVERFAQAETMPSSTRDGGFGLIIARRATTHLGGAIRLEPSASLGGAAVRVELPRARDAPA